MAWFGYWLMVIGTVMARIFILLNEATVLYTFYAPMMAHWAFYVCLTLVVVGSWFEGFVLFRRHARYIRENPGKKTPLFSYMAVINMAMWQIATLGVAATMLLQFIPWSIGLTDS